MANAGSTDMVGVDVELRVDEGGPTSLAPCSETAVVDAVGVWARVALSVGESGTPSAGSRSETPLLDAVEVPFGLVLSAGGREVPSEAEGGCVDAPWEETFDERVRSCTVRGLALSCRLISFQTRLMLARSSSSDTCIGCPAMCLVLSGI